MAKSIIPKHLPAFKNTTLLFVSDTTRAKWYRIFDKEIEKIGSIERKKPEYTDLKGHFNIDEIERNELDLFSKDLARNVALALKSTKAKHAIVCVPQRIKGAFLKGLPAEAKKKIIKEHDANLYRFNGLEILKLLYK